MDSFPLDPDDEVVNTVPAAGNETVIDDPLTAALAAQLRTAAARFADLMIEVEDDDEYREREPGARAVLREAERAYRKHIREPLLELHNRPWEWEWRPPEGDTPLNYFARLRDMRAEIECKEAALVDATDPCEIIEWAAAIELAEAQFEVLEHFNPRERVVTYPVNNLKRTVARWQ